MNPFHPAPGALPERIVGREPELSAMREAVRRAMAGSPPSPLVVIGQRGMGKTVLLRELRELGGAATLAVPLEVVSGQPLAETLREKLVRLTESVESLPIRVGRAFDAAVHAIPKVSYELPHHAGAIALSGAGDERSKPEDRTLAAMLGALTDAARAAKRYVTITVDEMQDADAGAMQTLVRFVHESAQGDAPVLLACAGLSETYALLERLRTYVQRWPTFELRLLTPSETIEAIREPIVAARAHIDENALDELASESAGYPYFIQAYGSAAWEAHHGKRVTLADVRASLSGVRARNEASFYVRPLAKLTPREMAFAIALAELGDGSHEMRAVAGALGVTAPDLSSTRASLVRKSIAAVPIPGRIEFRIPFTDRYLCAHRGEYETADVRAYRAGLARRSAKPRA